MGQSDVSVQEPILQEQQNFPHLLQYSKNIYSQNGEDGILEEILNRIEVTNRWFCEFGAWDGKHLSNTYRLLEEKGWKGVMIEGDKQKYAELNNLSEQYPDSLTSINKFISFRDSGVRIDKILNKTQIPERFGVLSIDVDGSDYFIWRDMKVYRADIVVIEIDSSIAPPTLRMSEIHQEGTSFQAMVNLGKKKGYTPVCHTGNLIFVRDELVDDVNIPEEELTNPQKLFIYNWTDEAKQLNRANQLKPPITENSVRENIHSSIKILKNRGLFSGSKYILDRIKNSFR